MVGAAGRFFQGGARPWPVNPGFWRSNEIKGLTVECQPFPMPAAMPSPTLGFLMTQPGWRVIAHCDNCSNDKSFDPIELALAHGEDKRVDQLKFRCTGWFKNPTCRALVKAYPERVTPPEMGMKH
jgi:hypothetical protein